MQNVAEMNQQDESVRSRRNALLMGGAALAGLALTRNAEAQAAITDDDILNFALNLEYLEAQFYTLATSGVTIDKMNGTITGPNGAAGGTVSVKSNPMVPFTAGSQVQEYAMETAAEERNHVKFLQTALGSAYVAMPNIDLMASFNTLAAAAGIATPFDPFASETNFLLGAFIFEDVGVTAYLGAAPLLQSSAILSAALGIHAVEAYHAGAIRTQIFRAGAPATTLSQQIAAARAKLDGTNTDDIGVGTVTNAALNQTASTIVDVVPSVARVMGRTTTQVLQIVYGGSATTPGVFFPQGMNGTIK